MIDPKLSSEQWIEMNNQRSSEAHQPLAALNEGDFERLYEQQKAENERLIAVMTASRLSQLPSSPPNSPVKAVVTAERVRALVGNAQFNQMSRAEKLSAVGCDPSVSEEFLKKVFGRGNNPSVGRDLHRTDPRRYATLREGALATNAYAT